MSSLFGSKSKADAVATSTVVTEKTTNEVSAS